VVIDLEDAVQYVSGAWRIRTGFILTCTRSASPALWEQDSGERRPVDAVRVAQNQGGVVRVVLDVNACEITRFADDKPSRLVIDFTVRLAP